MKNNASSKFKIIFGMMVIFLMISACNLGSMMGREENNSSLTTPTIQSNDELTKPDNEFVNTNENSSEQTVEIITVYRMDGTQEDVPSIFTSSTDLLEAKIDSGEWTEGQGLVILLKLFTGEINMGEVPGSDLVLEFSGTGAVRWAQDFLADEKNDMETKIEIERLLSIIFPSQEILDLISVPYGSRSNTGSAKVALMDRQASQSDCQDLAALGFRDEVFLSDHCYLYKEIIIEGFSYRVYFPFWWQGDGEFEVLIEGAISALSDSVVAFNNFGDMENINMMFSLLSNPKSPDTLAFQTYTPKGTTCPLTLMPSSSAGSIDVFKQTIAHEVFHCFQDWNFNTVPYSQNKWWGEGSAEYFSNVVYPSTNDEHRFLDQFDLRSRNESLQKMSYENFIFFQHAANTYGNQQVIELLRALGNAGGSASALASFQDMSDTFFEFVLKYMSTGINDTGGSMIIQPLIAVTGINPINDEGEETFSTSAFVATRYRMKYEKEKRFLQSPKPNENIKYSTVKNKDIRDPSKWSDLPPELRSTCDEDLMYAMVVTTTETSGSLNFIANIEKVEKAECDPCLLGVWEVDNSSFEEYIKRLLDSQGGMEDLPPGMEFKLEVDGHYYVEFKENSEMLTRRDNFSILSGAVGSPGLLTVIDSQGSGEYTTSDGKRLMLYNVVDFVNKVDAKMEGLPLNLNLTPGTGTYSMFGASASGPGFENSSDQDNLSSDYICEKDELMIDHPEFGKLLFNRVEKILPTPVPTASP